MYANCHVKIKYCASNVSCLLIILDCFLIVATTSNNSDDDNNNNNYNNNKNVNVGLFHSNSLSCSF